MSIGAINSCGIGHCKAPNQEVKSGKSASSLTTLNITTVKVSATVAATDTVVESLESDEREGSESGVIRNLLDGHFKSVADVRLRINFADEIAAMEAEKAAELTQTGITEINGTVAGAIETFLQTEGLDEGIAAIISDGLQNFDSISAEAALTESDSIAQLKSTFDAYIGSIRTGLAGLSQPVPEEITETPENLMLEQTATKETSAPSATAETSTIPDWQLAVEQFITDLTTSFETAISALNTELENLSVLPELSEPSGNGRAYDKFLAIYNQMRTSGGDISDSDIINVTA